MRDGKTVIVHEWSKVRSFLWEAGRFQNPKLLVNDCRNIVLDPKGRFVFISSSNDGKGLSIFRRTAPGKLVIVAYQKGIQDVCAIDPLGRFAYEQYGKQTGKEGVLRVWRILESGRLQYVTSEPSRENLVFAAR